VLIEVEHIDRDYGYRLVIRAQTGRKTELNQLSVGMRQTSQLTPCSEQDG